MLGLIVGLVFFVVGTLGHAIYTHYIKSTPAQRRAAAIAAHPAGSNR